MYRNFSYFPLLYINPSHFHCHTQELFTLSLLHAGILHISSPPTRILHISVVICKNPSLLHAMHMLNPLHFPLPRKISLYIFLAMYMNILPIFPAILKNHSHYPCHIHESLTVSVPHLTILHIFLPMYKILDMLIAMYKNPSCFPGHPQILHILIWHAHFFFISV